MKRLERKEYFMLLAKLTSMRGTCKKLQVGCVLVDAETNRIASVGYNSSHKGNVHCIDVGCLIVDEHCVRCPHAEIAAITNLTQRYEKLHAYVTHKPCGDCFKALVAAGVTDIYYDKDYKDTRREALSEELKSVSFHPIYFHPIDYYHELKLIIGDN